MGRPTVRRRAVSAAVELLREALRDPGIRAEIRAIILESELPSNDTEPERLLDAAEAGRLLKMTPNAIRTAAYRGSIPSVKIGRRVRFRPSDLIRSKSRQT